MKILVTGATGQVGFELSRSLQPLGQVIQLDKSRANFMEPEKLADVVAEIVPDIIVNAAAYTAVDQAEQDEAAANIVNGTAPGVLASAARQCGAMLIHYSTDYVFDGTKDSAYVETDATNPLNAYGRSKLLGEKAIAAAGGSWLILRTSWVYASRGQNFLSTMLRLAQEQEELRVVADQFGAPTTARLIADTTADILSRIRPQGSLEAFTSTHYNVVAAGETNWHGFASAIIEAARELLPEGAIKVRKITAIKSNELHAAALRPLNSRLSTEKLQQDFSLRMPDWRVGLDLCVSELLKH